MGGEPAHLADRQRTIPRSELKMLDCEHEDALEDVADVDDGIAAILGDD